MDLRETIKCIIEQVLNEARTKINDIQLASKLYADYNKKYFNGKLPTDIEISEKRIKGTYAVASATILNHRKYSRVTNNIAPENIKIKGIYFSNYYRLTDEQLKGVLLHEMIHIYLYTQGIFKTTGGPSGHGREFEEVRKQISSMSGIKIPISEDVTGVEAVSKGKLMVGVSFKNQSNKNAIVMLSPSFWARDNANIKDWFMRLVNVGRISDLVVFQTKHVDFQELPAKRSLKSVSMYSVPDDVAEEARKNIIWKPN